MYTLCIAEEWLHVPSLSDVTESTGSQAEYFTENIGQDNLEVQST